MELGRVNSVKTTAVLSAEEKKTEQAAKTKEETIKPSTDQFVKSDETQAVTYSRKTAVEEIKAMEEKRMNSFIEMLKGMIAKQGEEHNVEILDLKLNVTESDSLKAQQAIAEGGEWSVDAVATRIMDMAMSLAGGDKSKIGALREAVEQGFGEARKVWGGKMPSITDQTYTEVMKRFDEWEKGE